jgi:F0F1-type ATP synthase assembly protein I
MSEDRSTKSELEEPEGFWPDEPWPEQEPFEVIPYTPDTPEFALPEEPLADPSVNESGGYAVPDIARYQAADESAQPDHPALAIDQHHEESPVSAQPEDQYSWAVPIEADDIPSHDAEPGPPVPPAFVPDEGSYAYHTTEEPVEAEPQRELVDTRSWLDDSQDIDQQNAYAQHAADALPGQWNPQPQPPPDAFADDPFAPKAVEEYWVGQPAASDPNAPVHYVPETPEENIRRSGLAWSAGIAFFGSVAFMLFLGWLADLLLGTAPWGMVGGIVLGSIIGFIQFFRISSQIYGTGKQTTEFRPLLNQADDDIANENIDPPAAPPIL